MAGKKKQEITDYVICSLSLVPIYSKPNEHATLLSQMLFGESATIILKKDKKWHKIVTALDGVVGFIDIRQFNYITEKEFTQSNKNFSVSIDLCQVLKNDQYAVPITVGSSLPKFDGMVVQILDRKYVYNGQAVPFDAITFTPEMFENIANRFINAPYHFGGRSVFGLDNSAFVQLVYKCAGLKMPRTIQQMVEVPCTFVDFAELAMPGDLAFFIDKENVINHVGIMTGKNEILHVVEKVKQDYIDHEGIYDRKKKKYLYKLKYIARYR